MVNCPLEKARSAGDKGTSLHSGTNDASRTTNQQYAIVLFSKCESALSTRLAIERLLKKDEFALKKTLRLSINK